MSDLQKLTELVFLDDAVAYETWQAVGARLQSAAGSVNWWIGDWLNYGESRYGETYTQAIEDTGLDYQTLRNCKWVAASIQMSLRGDNLSWSHHREVASLEPKEQQRWLEKASQEGWSKSRLRENIRAAKALTREDPQRPAIAVVTVVTVESREPSNTGDRSPLELVAAEPMMSRDIIDVAYALSDDAQKAEMDRLAFMSSLNGALENAMRLTQYRPERVAECAPRKFYDNDIQAVIRCLTQWAESVDAAMPKDGLRIVKG